MSWFLDPNRALLLLVELSCAFALVRATSQWRRLRQDRDLRDAVLMAALVMALGGVIHHWRPEVSGYVAAGCWAALLLLPALGLRAAHRLAMARRYRAAMLLTRLAGVARPLGNWRATLTYYTGLERWSRGDRESGLQIWQTLADSHGPLERVISTERLAWDGRWDELAARLAVELAQNPGLWPSLLPMYLRALGETNRVDAMLDVVDRHATELGNHPASLGSCLLPIFAFTGCRESVEELLAGPLAALDPTSREAWLGTAELARGDTAVGEARLRALRGTDHLQRLALERRLARPVTPPALDTERQRIVAELRALWNAAKGVLFPCLPRRRPVVSWSLGATLGLAFLIELGHGGSMRTESLLALGALDPDLVRAGQWWRLLTAQWLHFGPVHLGYNLLSLLLLGAYVERALGRLGTLVVYLAAGTMGMLAHTLMANLGATPGDVLVGASGGVMGLAGALGAILLEGWRGRGLSIARRQLSWIALLVGLQAVIDLSLPGISFLGHALGAAVGFAVAGRRVAMGWRLWWVVTVPAVVLSLAGATLAIRLPWRKPACSAGEVTECRRACELGVLESCANLGYKYSVGVDVAQDFHEARLWLGRACQGGIAIGCADLGILHDRGEGGSRDHRRAADLYGQACEGGSGFGCRNLGLVLLWGRGRTRDPAQAVTLFDRACSSGDQKGCELARKYRQR